jgi:hypothetical protein
MISENVALLRRLLSKAKPTANGCLEWNGWKTATGYGSTYHSGKNTTTHRLMYRATKGEIPQGMVIMHSCDNPPCICPAHLSLGTHAENMQQSIDRKRHFESVKTHCDRGHELAGENLYICRDKRRHCKTCSRARQRMATGWPEDLAYSSPKDQGHTPSGLKRGAPRRVRAHQSGHCTNGHELAGRNRYVTPKGNVECRRCRQIARDRFGAAAKAKRLAFNHPPHSASPPKSQSS